MMINAGKIYQHKDGGFYKIIEKNISFIENKYIYLIVYKKVKKKIKKTGKILYKKVKGESYVRTENHFNSSFKLVKK